MKRAKAFTLIELLVVISIMAILIGLAIVGFSRVGTSAQERQTRAQMDVLMLMLSNYHDAAGGDYTLAGPVDAPTDPISLVSYDTGTSTWNAPAVANTLAAMNTLRRVQRNQKAYEQIGQDKLLKVPGGTSVGTFVSVMLDAWGNPIVYVPQEGLGTALAPVVVNGTACRITSLGIIAPAATPSPDARPFWASAGADGSFKTGDDNLYSFEN